MADEVLIEGPRLSQAERVVDTFLAPEKTFTDILRNKSWWLPFVIGTAVSYLFVWAVQTKVGWSQLVDNTILASPGTQARLASATPDIAATIHSQMLASFKYSFYASPLLSLFFLLIIAVVLWPTINFAFGAKATFSEVFCLANYAFLPASIKAVVVAIILLAGAAPENFTAENMLGTSPGYFLSTPGPLKTLLTAFDLFTLWTLVLMSIGLAIVGKTKRANGFIAVFGWWVLVVLLQVGAKAVFR